MTRNLFRLFVLVPMALIALTCVASAAGLVDPTADPGGFIEQVVTFGHTNWALGAGLALYGLLELAAWLGSKKGSPFAAWLGSGRITLVIAGSVTVLGAVLHALLAGGTVQAALVAAVAAFAAWWHPAASDVAAAKAG